MPSYMKSLTLAAMVAVAVAVTVPSVDHARCSGAQLVSSTTLHAGGHDVLFTTHSCRPTAAERRTGILPPISQDCQTIENAVVILQSTMPKPQDAHFRYLQLLFREYWSHPTPVLLVMPREQLASLLFSLSSPKACAQLTMAPGPLALPTLKALFKFAPPHHISC
ncbi:hypothetical protein JB92DRAFT_2824626 [Gautieria morchelliformis]|nr:hypothetical protein JB92DRAFT_2824626 [Gautieria morchelliformis]